MSEPTFADSSDQRAPGTPNPAGDVDLLADMVGLITAIILQQLGITPVLPVGNTNTPTNVASLVTELGSTAYALQSTQAAQPASGSVPGVATLDVNGLVPIAQLPVAGVNLFIISSGTPASTLGVQNDYALDINSGNLWGPKGASAWPGTAVGQLAGVASGWTGLLRVATTGVSGYTMVAAAGNVTNMNWTAPADGFMHRVLLFADLAVTTALTGGQINVNITDPGGTSRTAQDIISAAAPVGYKGSVAGASTWLIGSGSTIQMVQTAMTAGAAVLYSEFWGS